MSIYLDKRTGVWFERTRVDGVRKAKRLGKFTDRESAARAAGVSIKWTGKADIKAVVERYIAEEIPDRYTTKSSYLSKLNGYILPRWGADILADIRPMQLQQWFNELGVAPTTKSAIKTVFAQVWRFAQLQELVSAQHNPLGLVRIKGSSRRQKRPQVLTPDDCRRLVEQIIVEPFRLMVITALCLGLRRSELAGLKWCDFDWVGQTVQISRGVVDNRVGEVKTESSEKPLPLDLALISLLQAWRNTTPFREEDSWVWASPQQGGSLPYYPNAIQQEYLRPAGVRAGLGEHVGFHTLRHAYRSMLATAGASLTVQKELLRHSNISTTANVYGGALPEDQRVAQSAVTRMIIN